MLYIVDTLSTGHAIFDFWTVHDTREIADVRVVTKVIFEALEGNNTLLNY